ncbi:hypothetical protein BTO16_02085 [Polaribacter glomeratus]|uniref:Uncharacterized protein n=1 Tax=Polaribacter glomeratus TaxID=102 RepID=A0A2S7WV11_9FLAO|nr:hypothetical protein BTO16_02085 [Polaribacter glomeratus]
MGFYFFRLAENHEKNKWLFGFLGIIIFAVAYFTYVLFCKFFNSEEFNVDNLPAIGMKAFFIGLFFLVIIFHLLNFVWSKKKKVKVDSIDKIGE